MPHWSRNINNWCAVRRLRCVNHAFCCRLWRFSWIVSKMALAVLVHPIIHHDTIVFGICSDHHPLCGSGTRNEQQTNNPCELHIHLIKTRPHNTLNWNLVKTKKYVMITPLFRQAGFFVWDFSLKAVMSGC